MENKRILLSFDALFDTRLPILEDLHPQARDVVLRSTEYYLREQDDWFKLTGGRVTNEQFKAAWEKRDNEVRWRSVITGILSVILKILTEYDINVRDNIIEQEVTLELNVWPYSFVDDEVLVVEEHLRRLFGRELVIQFTSVPLEALTPAYLIARYDLAILYEFHDWIKCHATTLYQQRANKFAMIVPKLFENNISALTVAEKQRELQRFQMEHLEFMDFQFIDARYMSQFK